MTKLSVIICTYNPRHDIFERCLRHLSEAGLQLQPFEVLIIDNNSLQPVGNNEYIRDFIKKFPQTKVIKETKQGLTPARLRAIQESKGDIILFIDDDNFISKEFLLTGINIAETWPMIGSWSGQVKLLFESEPDEWSRKYWGMLVYREFKGKFWSNLPNLPDTMPCGAGLFVRRQVAEYYNALHKSGKRSIQLDRTANSLSSGGDNDLAACACDIGLGVGLFDNLMLEHFIPVNRTTKEYFLKLAEGIAHSAVIFRSYRGVHPGSLSLKNKLANLLRVLLKNNYDRKVQRAVYQGEYSARTLLANNKNVSANQSKS
jgi:glycosyltransferase involved in cell wall biosynthesis